MLALDCAALRATNEAPRDRCQPPAVGPSAQRDRAASGHRRGRPEHWPERGLPLLPGVGRTPPTCHQPSQRPKDPPLLPNRWPGWPGPTIPSGFSTSTRGRPRRVQSAAKPPAEGTESTTTHACDGRTHTAPVKRLAHTRGTRARRAAIAQSTRKRWQREHAAPRTRLIAIMSARPSQRLESAPASRPRHGQRHPSMPVGPGRPGRRHTHIR